MSGHSAALLVLFLSAAACAMVAPWLASGITTAGALAIDALVLTALGFLSLLFERDL